MAPAAACSRKAPPPAGLARWNCHSSMDRTWEAVPLPPVNTLARQAMHMRASCMESQDRSLEALLPPARRNTVTLPSVVRHMLGQVGCPDKNPPAQHKAPVSMAPRTDSAAPCTDSSIERVARALGRLRAEPGSALRRGTAPSTFERHVPD